MSSRKKNRPLHPACPNCPHLFPARVPCGKKDCHRTFKKKRLKQLYCSTQCADAVRARRLYMKRRWGMEGTA